MTSRRLVGILALALVFILHPHGGAPGAAEGAASPASPGTQSRVPLPGSDYDPALPDPDGLLGFPLGSRVASPDQIAGCLRAWERASGKIRVEEYARTHEGRPLFSVIVTSEGNHARREEIRAGYAALADPEGLSAEDGRRLVESLPAVAWLAYSIHGDETSGADASLALAYHLVASKDAEVGRLLDEVVVIIDPMMNPDGRARWHQQLAQHRGEVRNVDDQSLLHSGYWPFGRMNHYLFDLNRDWIYGVHPETRGRIRTAGEWNPLLFIDAHEMGPQDTYLFSPARSPRNPHVPSFQDDWNTRFAADQAAAFDRFGWTYYTGEWNEGWYPGYSDAWASFRGAIGILYEQAGVAEDAVRRPHGALLGYAESVQHQLVSSLANLESLRAHAVEIRGGFLDARRAAIGSDGPYAGRTFAVLPTANKGRLRRFVDLMHLQGIRVYEAESAFTAKGAIDQLGRDLGRTEIPAGAILVPNRQPLAHLVAAMLEFDTRMSGEYLARERRELLKHGRSTVYDVTAWNVTMMYGLEALTLEAGLPDGARRLDPADPPGAGGLDAAGEPNIWLLDGADDRSVAAAARLLEEGFEVRVTDLPFELEGRRYARGSLALVVRENAAVGRAAADLRKAVERVALETGLTARGAVSGLGAGDLPDIGGRHFRLLEPPRIALIARGGVSGYDFGSIWHLLDRALGIRHTHLDEERLDGSDLRRYNVLVLPDRWFGAIPPSVLPALRTWVESGGTLIAVGDAAEAVAAKEPEISSVRILPAVLEELDRFEQTVRRQWMAESGLMPPVESVWSHAASSAAGEPWSASKGAARPSIEELKAREAFQRPFMPRGAILAGRVDTEHWLTFGASPVLPVLTATAPVLMAAQEVEAPVRFGVLARAEDASRGSAAPGAGSYVGWAPVPEGYEMRLRMSGLLWPEAAERIAGSAWVTREAKGRGQVILFAAPPVFRGAALGTARILANALVYGPGLGASHPIRP